MDHQRQPNTFLTPLALKDVGFLELVRRVAAVIQAAPGLARQDAPQVSRAGDTAIPMVINRLSLLVLGLRMVPVSSYNVNGCFRMFRGRRFIFTLPSTVATIL